MDIDENGTVDQYEFVLSSLILLGKVDIHDIKPIMSKFRKLAGEEDVIRMGEMWKISAETFDNDETHDIDEDGNLLRDPSTPVQNFFDQMKTGVSFLS